MIVKIIKSNDTGWYAARIGAVYHVEQARPLILYKKYYQVLNASDKLILKTDCEVLKGKK